MKEVYSYPAEIKRLLSLPPREVLGRIYRYVLHWVLDQVGRLKAHVFGGDISQEDFAQALKSGLRETLLAYKKRDNIFLTHNGSKKEGSKNDLQDLLSPGVCRVILEGAEKVCEHKFDLLGSGEVFLGVKIDWHTDFKTGYRWNPRSYYKDIAVPYGKGDIKVVWELSRFQHLVLLGQAYWITSDEKYSQEFRAQVLDWISENPPEFGPNWACTMDVAIRAANFLVGWEFFKRSPLLDEAFVHSFLQSLLVHARFIRSNLEWSEELTSNHYMGDLSGLFFIACMVPEFKESAEWLRFSKDELEKECRKQVLPDGTNFEASTCYHRLVLEFFLYSYLIGLRNNLSFSNYYIEVLKKMLEVLCCLLGPDGTNAQIGDNDSGRFFKFEPPRENTLDMRYLLGIGAALFDDPGLKVYESDEIRSTIYFLFGPEALRKFLKHPTHDLKKLKSRAFPDSGWYILRKRDDYLLISCGPNGQNNKGGHGHNDKLSFVLFLNGENIIVDPGSYLYTVDPDSRNHFRSTSCHNTIQVMQGQVMQGQVMQGMEEEQNRFVSGLLFALHDDARAKLLKWNSHDEEDFFSGEHYGYRRLRNPVVHRREITFDKQSRRIKVTDLLEGSGETSFVFHLHFAPGCLLKTDRNILGVHTPVGREIKIEFPEWTEPEKTTYFYSSSYGLKEVAEKVYFKGRVNLPLILNWKIQSCGGGGLESESGIV